MLADMLFRDVQCRRELDMAALGVTVTLDKPAQQMYSNTYI